MRSTTVIKVRSTECGGRRKRPRGSPESIRLFVLRTYSKQKIPLRERQDVRWLARQQLAVRADFVRLGVDLDLRERVVHHEILLPQRAAPAHRRQRTREAL